MQIGSSQAAHGTPYVGTDAPPIGDSPQRRSWPVVVIIVLGLALRVWQYAFDNTLWLDEIALTRNIVGLSLHDLLLRPLSFDQVAPRGFLLLEKLASLVFGPSELALRLVPFVISIVGLLLFARLAHRLLGDTAALFAMFAYAIAIPLVRYSAEVKQYGLDATATTALLLLALGLLNAVPSRRRLWASGFAGVAIVWFSQTAVIVLAGLGLALGIRWLMARDRVTLQPLLVTVPLWAIAALLAVAAGIDSMTPSTKQFMTNFWDGGFFPWPASLATDARWLWTRLTELFADRSLLRYRWPTPYLALATLGVAAIWRRRSVHGWLLAGPPAMGLLAAVAHQYPLNGRVNLYLVPILLLAVAAGADQVRRTLGRYSRHVGLAAMFACLAGPVATVVATPPPFVIENYRPLYSHLRDNRRAGDSVYVQWMALSGAIYYGPRYGLQRSEWRKGICNGVDVRPFIRDLDRYRGVARLWVVSPGLRPFRTVQAAQQGYLSTIGVRRDSVFVPSLTHLPLELDLYDLSDTVRLKAADAETFPVQPMPTDPAPGCRDWSGQPGQ